MASVDYAVGFEPATTEFDESFRLKTVGAGETIGTKLTMKFQKINA